MTTFPLLERAGTSVLSNALETAGPFRVPSDTRPHLRAVKDAREAWANARAAEGLKHDGSARILTPPESQAKLGKGSRPLYSVTLLPSDLATLGFTTCGSETALCRAACVMTHGRGAMPSVIAARRARTRLLATDPQAFVILVASELRAARSLEGRPIGVRLNAASDIRWERVAPGLLRIPGVRAYDYTKHADRGQGSDRYRLTYSVSERPGSVAEGLSAIARGGTATVVLDVAKGSPLPTAWAGGVRMIDGDAHDDRASDPRGVWIGLRAKGRAIGTGGQGFVMPADPAELPARAMIPRVPVAA